MTAPADPREVIAGAVGGSTADDVLEALAAAGLAVVPVVETHAEWGAQRTARWGSTVAGPMWKAEARAFAAGAPNDTIVGMVRRPVYVGPWEPVPDDD